MIERVIIVGAGAVGGAVAGLLDAAKVPVLLVARGAHLAAIRDNGLRLRRPSGEVLLRSPVTDRPEWRSGDVALLCVKSQDTAAALAGIPETTPVVCAQNGVENEALAARTHATVLGMMVGVHAVHLVPGQVDLHDDRCPGVLDLGTICGDPSIGPDLARMLERAGFASLDLPDIAAWKRAKLVSNLPGILPISVRHFDRDLAKAVTAEGEEVMRSAGLPYTPLDQFWERMAIVGHAPINGVERPGSSLWQSKTRGSGSEVEFLNGFVERLGSDIGVPTPVNSRLLRLARGD